MLYVKIDGNWPFKGRRSDRRVLAHEKELSEKLIRAFTQSSYLKQMFFFKSQFIIFKSFLVERVRLLIMNCYSGYVRMYESISTCTLSTCILNMKLQCSADIR